MSLLKSTYFLFLLMFCLSCDSSDEKKVDQISNETATNNNLKSEEKKNDHVSNESKHIENIYFNVPSPMETAIILNKAGAIYDHNLPLSPEIGHKYQTSEEQAIVLGVYGTDLNYSVVSNEIMETELYLQSINLLGEKLGLDNILNETIKTRVDNNIHSIDSMQVIISQLFWEVESSLKTNGRKDISALVVAGGWIEGLYIASQLSIHMVEKDIINTLISEQKYSFESLIPLLESNNLSDQVNETLVVPIKELKIIFDDIKESINPTPTISNNDVITLGDNIELIYNQETIDQIRISIAKIRNDIIQ